MEVLNQTNPDLKREIAIKDSKSDQFVTVVSVGTEKDIYENINFQNSAQSKNQLSENGFVTVLTIGDEVTNEVPQPSEVVEEVLVYRLPGERLGFGLKFEGGTKTTECVKRLFIQSCAPDSPASRVKCSWGTLSEGDEVLKIDSMSVKNMTRIDCVRCLKDSNVVINLLVRHCKQPTVFAMDTSPFHSDEDLSYEENLEKKRGPPPPPPIPPRKMSRKLLNKDKMLPPKDIVDVDNPIARNRQTTEIPPSNEKGLQRVPSYPKSAPRTRQLLDTPPKVPMRDRKLSDVSSGPPDAEVYLDLLSQELEYGIKTESESDDTGSTISTVIDKHNSVFFTSNSSSIASDSIPSTPTAVQKHMDISKVVNPFEMLEMEYASEIQPNDDFLFTRFVSSHDVLLEYENGSTNDLRSSEGNKNSLTPPANFQDAPLSYGNEDVSTIATTTYENKTTNESSKENEFSENIEEIETKIVEEIKVPKPVPRKCYAKKTPPKLEIEETVKLVEDTTSSDAVDFNLPRLVNFVPKVPTKAASVHDIHFSFTEEQTNPEETDFKSLCLSKFNHRSDDFSYLCAEASDIFECNNNDCDKIISCSTWSLPNQLATIGESEEELDSLDNNKQRYEPIKIEDTKTDNRMDDNNLLQQEETKIQPILCNDYRDNIDMCGQLNYANDKRKSIFNQLDDSPVSLMPSAVELNTMDIDSPTSKKEAAIQLVHNGSEPIKEDCEDLTSNYTSKDGEQTETMEESNFIQSDQPHVITTSEYSSLSSLSSPPLSFSSRLPPDGQEFPPICQESRHNSSQDVDLVSTPSLPKSEPSLPTIQPRKSLLTSEPPADPPSTPSWVKSPTESRNLTSDLSNVRSSLWRRDEHSAGSVKDKIAVFSSANSKPLLPQNFANLNKTYKSTENVNDDKSNLLGKKNRFSKSCVCVNKIPNSQSDLTNTSSTNNLFESNSEVDVSQNAEPKNKEKDEFEFTKPSFNHTMSFSSKPNVRLHTRSHSMLDMSSLDAPWNNSDSRRLTLNSLIEQRRKGLSKLRGLVIPQTEVPIAEPVLDLPEIRSKESNIVNKQCTLTNRSKSESFESQTNGHQRSNSMSLNSPSWKPNSFVSNLPRYSPAFKRKCLQVYVMEQSSTGPMSTDTNSQKTSDSVFHSDDEIINSSSNNGDKFDEVFDKTSCFPEPQKISPKSIEGFTSPSNSEISFEYSYHSTTSNNSIEPQPIESIKTNFHQTEPQNYYSKKASLPKHKNDLGRSEDDSDNDSAVSSSQSSYISRECSPLPSPQEYPGTQLGDGSNDASRKTESYNNGLPGRVLKPKSVEAINRKNILASAKCRSGRDFKNGSPLIQRKLNDTEEETNTENDLQTESPVEKIEEANENNVIVKDETETSQDSLSSDNTLETSKSDSQSSDESTDKINKQYIPQTTTEPITLNKEILRTPETGSNPELSSLDIKSSSRHSSLSIDETDNKITLKTTSKLSTSTVTLRSTGTTNRKLERPTSAIYVPSSSRHDPNKRASVNDIRKQFEKFELENQKSPTLPEPKTPIAKSSTKTNALKSPTEHKVPSVSTSTVSDKANIAVPKDEPICTNDLPSRTVTSEDLEKIVTEVNEGIDQKSDLYVNQNDAIVVVLHREISGGSVGITLTGGTDYEAKEITVHKVLNGGCAHKDGRLKKGDRILSINGKKMIGLTHKESIDILKDPRREVTLVVLPCKGKVLPTGTSLRKASSEVSIAEETSLSPSPIETQSKESVVIRVELVKDGAGLGFSLDGGRDSPKGDKPLIIKKIFTGGAAEKCGKLQASDELVEVNEVEVHKMTRIEVWSLMKKLPDGKVTLTIRR